MAAPRANQQAPGWQPMRSSAWSYQLTHALQSRFDFLQVREHRLEQIADALEPVEHIANRELFRLQALLHFRPSQRRRYRRSGMRARHIWSGDSLRAGDLQIVEIDLPLL